MTNRVLIALGKPLSEISDEMVALATRAYETRHWRFRPTAEHIRKIYSRKELSNFLSLFAKKPEGWVWMHEDARSIVDGGAKFVEKELQFPECWVYQIMAVRCLNALNNTSIHNPNEFI